MVYQSQPLRIGWRRRLEKEEKMICDECKQERESGIVDKIALCHVCYINKGGRDDD
jgi:hypothetical protein